MNATEWVALLASVATFLSLVLNVYQWRGGAETTKTARSNAQSAFNTFHRAAEFADRIRQVADRGAEEPVQALQVATQQAHAINGAADAARLQISAYCREHLNFIPQVERAWAPSRERLPEPLERLERREAQRTSSSP